MPVEFRIRYFLVLLFLFSLQSSAHATRRAFVFGVSNYPLKDMFLAAPIGDANTMAAFLRSYDFTIYSGGALPEAKAGMSNFKVEWAKFVQTVKRNDEVVVYYSGHGVAVKERNYLVPKDFNPNDAPAIADPEKLLISLAKLVNDITAQHPKAAIWVLDACRDNNFHFQEGKGLRTQTSVPIGNLMLYSASDGAVSNDGSSSGNSIYTRTYLPIAKQQASTDAMIVARNAQLAVIDLHIGQNPDIFGILPVQWCLKDCTSSMIQAKFDDGNSILAKGSLLELGKTKSLQGRELRQNALFLGRKSTAKNCSEKNSIVPPIGCTALADLVEGRSRNYVNKEIAIHVAVNIRKRAPIIRKSIAARYSCVVDTLLKDSKEKLTGILELKYSDDTFYWGTVSGNKECERQS